MPRVIGAVDSSLIPIGAPYNEEQMYVCDKIFHAILTVCRWQGSVHNSAPCSIHIFKMVVDKIAGCLGITAMECSDIY